MKKWLIANPLPTNATSCNKDLNSGYGTIDNIGSSVISRILGKVKKKNIKLPVLALGYVAAILKTKGIEANYSERASEIKDLIINNQYEACVIYCSMVGEKIETEIIKFISEKADIKIIIIGTYPTKLPHKFTDADLIILGEPEKLFLEWNGELTSLLEGGGTQHSRNIDNLDQLPDPDYSLMNFQKFSYKPMLKGRCGFIESSRGCPYSCGYYCTYGENQGAKIRSYSPQRIVKQMKSLHSKFGFNSFQFRDPVFGLSKKWVLAFCEELRRADCAFKWGIETRLDLLSIKMIDLMKENGLSSINVGVETPNVEIAKANKRKLDAPGHQEEIINYAAKIGIKMNAFYILGLEHDTLESCYATINYSLKLNTYMARYSVCTPYPGTEFYSEKKSNNEIETYDPADYDQMSLVYKHRYLNKSQIDFLIQKAYISYYLNPKKIWAILSR